MKRTTRRLATALLVVAVGAVVLVAAGSGSRAKSQVSAGGTYKVGWEQSFGFTDNMDPVGEYLAEGFAIQTSLLDRTLVGYNHVPGAAGNKIVPDIATAVPTPTNGGKTYTFHIKQGVKFGPPVNRQVTSADFLNEMKRLASPKDGQEYGFYYNVIKGFASGKGKTISGISTPNASTIVFNLTQPTGDFLYRMSMGATSPQPAEVTKCFEGQAGKYGNDLISTGPYMIQGIDKVDISDCSKITAASGYDGTSKMILVRNPNYDPKTDSTAARQNLPDEFDFLIDANKDDIYSKVAAGDFQDEVSSPPGQVLEKYYTSHSPLLKQYSGDRTWYLTMNLTSPPFDDVHVRKAFNFIIEQERARTGVGWTRDRQGRPPHRPGHALQQPARRVQPVCDTRRQGQPVEGKGCNEGLEVRHEGERHVFRECLPQRVHARRHARAGSEDGARDRGRCQEDRHHLQGALDQRRVSHASDAVEERSAWRAPGLG